MQPPNVVITGLGLVSAVGHDAESFWSALVDGRSAAAPVSAFDTASLNRHVACQIADPPRASPPFIAADYGAGQCSQHVLSAVAAALDDAGLCPPALVGRRVAVLVGTTMGDFEFIERAYDDLDPAPPPPDSFRRAVENAPGRLSRLTAAALGLPRAFCLDLYGACAAGNMALINAQMMLQADECDLVLAGGADAFSRFAFVGFMRNRVMAKDTCRPFDKNRDGLLLGEGAGVFVIEREAGAIGRRRYARLLGGGMSCDAYNPTCPRPDGRGIEAAVRQAVQTAGIETPQIDYVCAHGTGTPRNDLAEWEALNKLLAPDTPFSSIKALIGHAMGAAGALEAAACALACTHQRLIPQWNLADPALDGPARPVRQAAPANLRHVANLSFGFGGYNSCLVMGPGAA